MDLSFRPPDAAAESALPAADMALLVAMLGERRMGSETARVQATLSTADAEEALLAPAGGAFNGAMAARLAEWREE